MFVPEAQHEMKIVNMNEWWFTSDDFDNEEEDHSGPVEHVVDGGSGEGSSEFVAVTHLR